MVKYTFDWDSSEKKLKSLILAFDNFRKNEPETFAALHLANETWHLTDWVYNEFKNVYGFSDLGNFRSDLYNHCDSLKIMHDIANASKHSEVSRPKASIKTTEKHDGHYSSIYYDSKYYDTTRLEIHLLDGTILNFDEEMEKTINFWIDYFKTSLAISL